MTGNGNVDSNPNTTVIYFVRHGEVHNPGKILYARLPRFRLSERGQWQAQQTAKFLSSNGNTIAAIISSPMLRARQTARYVADAQPHDLAIRQSALLNEIYTPYQGWPYTKLDDMDWDLYKDIDPESKYETLEDVVARMKQFIRQTLKRFPGQSLIAVTHGDLVLSALMWAQQRPFTHAERRREPYPVTAGIVELKFPARTLDSNGNFKLPQVQYIQPYTET